MKNKIYALRFFQTKELYLPLTNVQDFKQNHFNAASMNNSSNPPEGIKILFILLKWKKYIVSFFLIATIGAAIFSGPYFIPPLYKSEVILYTPGTNSGKYLIETNPGFGSEKEINEQIQILQSGILRDSITKKYDLITHYGINTTKVSKLYDLYKKFTNHVNIERTRYNSISVAVYDTDPVIAANMANDIVKIGDDVKAKILSYNLKAAYSALMKKNNVADTMPVIANYVPVSYIVTPAKISYKKVFPVRWLIVLITSISSLLFFSMIALFIEKFKKIRTEMKSEIHVKD